MTDPIAVASLCPVCKGKGYVQDKAVKYPCPVCSPVPFQSQFNEKPLSAPLIDDVSPKRKPGRPKVIK